MAGTIAVLHLIGWVTLLGFVAPQHFSIGDRALGVGVGVGLTAYMLGLRHVIVGLFVFTWVAALLIWRFARIEERWSAPADG